MSTKEIGLVLCILALGFMAFVPADAKVRDWALWVLGVGLMAIICGRGR